MATTFQGFALAKNLQEVSLDEDVISNLAGSPVGNDIKLFFNNTKNTSTLTITLENIVGSTIIFNDPTVFAVFTNKTKISVVTDVYYVKNSNGINTFQLSTKEDLSDTVLIPPTGIYVRPDEVTQDNFSNYSAVRREVSDRLDREDNNDFFLENISVLLDGGVSPRSSLEIIDTTLDAYQFRSSRTLNKVSNFLGSKFLQSSGVVFIKDPDDINSQGFSSDTPGLFIYDKTSNSAIRAFNSNQNPWEGLTEYLQTTSTDITVGRLVLDNTTGGILFELKDPTIKTIVPAAVTRTTFTHKLPVSVNGEIYYLCLKLN